MSWCPGPRRKNLRRPLFKRRTLLLGLALMLILPQTLCAEPPTTVRIGAFNFYPAMFRDGDGDLKGFYVDALADLAKRENLQIEYVYGSWSEGLERIRTGEVDLLTSVARTPERAAYLDYSRNPLLTVWGELYVAATSPIDNIVKIEGKTVAVMKNDFNGHCFIEMIEKFGVTCTIVKMPGFEAIFKAVAAGQVDAGVVNNTFGVPKHKAYRLRSTGVVFNPFDIYFAVAKGQNRDLLDLFDTYLARWRSGQDPAYITARQRWAHGTLEKVRIAPRWLQISVIVFGLLAVAGGAFILLLRRQVARATATIVQRETSLRQSNEMIQLLLDSTAEALFGLDPEGACTFCNAACVKLLGYEQAGQLIGKKLHRSIHFAHDDKRLLPEEDCAILKTCRTGAGVHVDNESFWRADGTSFPVEYRAFPIRRDGRIIGSVVTFLDATERKKLEETYLFLSQSGYGNPSDNFMTELVQHLGASLDLDWVCINRLREGRKVAEPVAIYCRKAKDNGSAYALEGTPCSQTLDRSVCCYPRGVQNLFPQAEMLKNLDAEGFVGSTLYDGDGRPIGLIAAIASKPMKNPELAKAILKLVSLRTAGELERIAAKETLLQKNAEIERFTYAVSHDLKSPLVTIKTFLNYLQQDVAAGHAENIEKDMGFILAAADKMDLLLDDLLRMSRVGRLENPPMNIAFGHLVEEVLETMAGAIKERGVEVSVQPAAASLYGDRMRLGEIWQNLIDNAIKYMGAQPDPRIEIGLTVEDDAPVFFVRDNGIGIDPGLGDKIFGMFEKIDPQTEGAGLGLALVKKIVELYKGRIWLKSDGPGHGSCFFFTLPDAYNPEGENPT